MKNSKVSIIIPVYNTSSYLKECLDSVARQTYKNIEVIMVDDGSTDDSAEMCKQYTSADMRFKLIRVPNSGVSSARNVGISNATGDYISFLDSDDLIADDMIEYLLEIIQDGDVSTCKLSQIDKTGRSSHSYQEIAVDKIDVLSGKQAIMEILYSKESIINGSFCKLFKADLFRDVRFDTSIYYAEDLLINYFVFKKSKKISVGSKRKYYYRVHNEGAMRKPFSQRRMTGLEACRLMLDDAYAEADPEVIAASKNRLFMEAIAIILQIPNQTLHLMQKRECIDVIKHNKKTVLLDANSKIAYRLYALIYFAGIVLGTQAVRIVRKSKGEI